LTQELDSSGAAATDAAAPLRGVRILDLTRLFPFSYGTQFLVDLGAEVVKIEEPGGEVGRAYAGQYAASNRGKRSVAVDLRDARGRHDFLDLVASADAIIESFRPGYLDQLGLGYTALRRHRPSLVLCSVSGYADDGPNASVPGHDLNYYVLAGAAWPDSSLPPVLPAVPVVDMAIGMHVSSSLCAALLGVGRGGPASHVRLSMADLALSLNTSSLVFACSEPARRAVPYPEFILGQVPCYRVWQTADGRWIALCNLEPKFWRAFLSIIDRDDLADRQFATGPDGDQVVDELARIIADRTRAEWAAAFAGREVCFSEVTSPEEALVHPEFQGRGLVRTIDGVPEVLFPGTFDGVRPARPITLAAPGADDDALRARARSGLS
jgi:alpha-methylacyl-CoA racemase